MDFYFGHEYELSSIGKSAIHNYKRKKDAEAVREISREELKDAKDASGRVCDTQPFTNLLSSLDENWSVHLKKFQSEK